jgi:hypothetical protein
LRIERRPEDARMPKRVEPERLDVVGEGRAGTENQGRQNREQEQPSASARPPGRPLIDDDVRPTRRAFVH